MITVTKTFLPPIEEYTKQLQRAWENRWLTNRGPLLIELEEKLKEKLNTPHILVVNNGTIPLQIALKLLGKEGEIITTPFSYVATTSAIVWENCTPVFVDIHPEYFTIDETKIEAAITSKTTANRPPSRSPISDGDPTNHIRRLLAMALKNEPTAVPPEIVTLLSTITLPEIEKAEVVTPTLAINPPEIDRSGGLTESEREEVKKISSRSSAKSRDRGGR